MRSRWRNRCCRLKSAKGLDSKTAQPGFVSRWRHEGETTDRTSTADGCGDEGAECRVRHKVLQCNIDVLPVCPDATG